MLVFFFGVLPQQDPTWTQWSCRSEGWGGSVFCSATAPRYAHLSPKWPRPSSAHWGQEWSHPDAFSPGICSYYFMHYISKCYLEPSGSGTGTWRMFVVLWAFTIKRRTTGLGVPGCTRKERKTHRHAEHHELLVEPTHLWIRYIYGAGVLLLTIPRVLYGVDLWVIELSVGHVGPSWRPPEGLIGWEHLLWERKDNWESSQTLGFTIEHMSPTLIHPVWNPI